MTTRNLSDPIKYLIVGTSALYYLFMFFVRVLPTIMTKDLMLELHASGMQISLLMVSFFYAYALSQIPAGILIDRYGAKRILVFGTLGCIFSSYLFQATHNLWIAIFSRVLLGIFCAPSFIAPMALVKKHLSEKLFAPTAGLIQVLGCIGAMLTTPASVLVTQTSWSDTILISVLLACLLFLLYTFFPNDTPSKRSENRISTKAALYLIISTPSFWLIGFLALASWSAVGGFAEAWGVSYLSLLQDISISQASAQMNWAWIGVAISSPLAGFWFETADNKVIPLASMYVMGFISMSLLTLGLTTNPYIISSLLFFLGTSAGAQPIAFKLVSKISPDNIHATAISFCNICVIAGAFIVQPLISQILELVWDGAMIDKTPLYKAYQFQISFSPIVIIMLFAIIASFYIQYLETK